LRNKNAVAEFGTFPNSLIQTLNFGTPREKQQTARDLQKNLLGCELLTFLQIHHTLPHFENCFIMILALKFYS